MSRRWQGTALFALLMAGVSATVAGRMLVGGDTTTAGAAAGTGTATDPSTTQQSAAPSGTGTGTGTGTVKGKTEQTRFGAVQVSVTFSGSRITSVQTLQAPSESGRDEMLTRYATPQLAQEVIASQSAKVDTISGATYTSEGYLASVQSAIDAHG